MSVVAWVLRESKLFLVGVSHGSETSVVLVHNNRQALVLTPFVRSG
jgi:hypothetical protein